MVVAFCMILSKLFNGVIGFLIFNMILPSQGQYHGYLYTLYSAPGKSIVV